MKRHFLFNNFIQTDIQNESDFIESITKMIGLENAASGVEDPLVKDKSNYEIKTPITIIYFNLP